MPTSLLISAISENWQKATYSFYPRLAALMRLSAEQAAVPLSGSGPRPLHVVVAPEYYFRKSPVHVIGQLSETYHGGRGVDKKETPGKAIDQHQLDNYEGPKWSNTLYSKAECDLLISAMCTASQSNTLIIPGSIFWAEKQPLMQTSKKRVVQVGKGVARNTSFVFYNGNLIHTYHKRVDSHEFDDKEGDAFDFIGGDSGGTFNVGGLKVGVEICADHGRGIVKGMATDLDIHVVVSDGMSPVERNFATRTGGVFVGCDTMSSTIYQNGNRLKMGQKFTEAVTLS